MICFALIVPLRKRSKILMLGIVTISNPRGGGINVDLVVEVNSTVFGDELWDYNLSNFIILYTNLII